MANFEIAVFVTKDVYDDNGYQARDRVATFTEGAFGETSRHTVDVLRADETPNPPQEKINSSVSGNCICDWTLDCSWDNLLDWWDDWLIYSECNDSHTQAADCNLLVTAADGGGLGGGRNSTPGTAITNGGLDLKDLPSSYEPYVWTTAGKKMWVALQEMGHSLIDGMPDSDGDGTGHDSARVIEDPDNGKETITPMGITGDATWNRDLQNNCGKAYDKSSVDGKSACFWNDSCTTKYFTKLSNQ